MAGSVVSSAIENKSMASAHINIHCHSPQAPGTLAMLRVETSEPPVSEILQVAAKMTGLEVETLQEHIPGNFKRVFLDD